MGPGRTARHSAINDIIYRGLVRAGFPSTKEPVGLCRSDGKRPDGLTMTPWKGGRSLIWDVTVSDTLAASYVPSTSVVPGAAAEQAALRKHSKYEELSRNFCFVPLAFESFGPICAEATDFLCSLGARTAQISNDSNETKFLFQRISVVIQRFNSVALHGTFQVHVDDNSEQH